MIQIYNGKADKLNMHAILDFFRASFLVKVLFCSTFTVSFFLIPFKVGSQTKRKKKKTKKRRKSWPRLEKNKITEYYNLYLDSTEDGVKKATIALEKDFKKYKRDPRVLALLSQLYTHTSYKEWHAGNELPDFIKTAKALAQRAIKYDNQLEDGYRALGGVYLVLDKRGLALRNLKKAVKISKNKDAEALYLYACASPGSIVDETTPAGRRMKKALEVNPKLIWALQDIMMFYLKAGDLGNAEKVFEKFAKDYSDHPDYFYYEGTLKLHQDKKEEARASYEKFMKKNPRSYLTNYIKLYLER